MAGGYGAAGFGAGFGKGLVNVLMAHRQQEQERSDKDFAALLPVHLQLAAESGDYSGVENLIKEHNPTLAASLKKNSPFQHLHEMIGPQLKMSAQQPEMSNAPQAGMGGLPLPPAEPPPPGMQAEPPPLPSRTVATELLPGTSAPTGNTFFGTPVATPEERATRGLSTEVAARNAIAKKLNMSPEDTVRYSATGQIAPPMRPDAEPYQQVDGEDAKGNPVKAVFDQTKGLFIDQITRQPIPGFRPRSTTSGGNASEFDKFLVSYANEKAKPVEALTTSERLDARAKFAEAGRAPTAAGADPTALARLAVRNPTVLQGLTPTVAGGVLATIASDPQLSAQYEQTRMAPIRTQAQTALDTMNDLLVTNPKTGKVALTPGAMQLYGYSGTLGKGIAGLAGGMESQTAKAALDQLTGQLTLDLLRDMKAQSRTGATGFGQLSARELDVLQSSATMLKGNISEPRALQELIKMRDRFQKILQPMANEQPAGGGSAAPTNITLDTPVFIGPDGKPRLGAP